MTARSWWTRSVRVAYSNIRAFVRDYGKQLDRVGPDSGQYLALRFNGVTSSFEERALPISSLARQLYRYELTGHLPEGWTIEISEVARAFGHGGGGAQVLVRDMDHVERSVHELVHAKVLK
ncbi:hypothetical protein LK09_19870 [Microbacterium mangrovi]|uniref:TNT domain-containing protein n=1 Tax=Microbacterium mangrovi TaxID=1348253 RepID=A0A0B2A042_9MICO|nr:TNT domain-containing protein [Microbacterium mangrovi]KHK95167.1 hypothetical protein LK09_19870 [Microbacterium mangrovi]